MNDHPLSALTGKWTQKIKAAWDVKKKQFQDDADEALKFFHGPYDWMYDLKVASKPGAFSFGGDVTEAPKPTFLMTVNKVSELVQLFGPALYHRNPVRQVNPREFWMPPPELYGDPADPNVQMYHQQVVMQLQQSRVQDKARATLLERYLNFTPTALDLKTDSRAAIDEALIKGMGLLWHEVYQAPGSEQRMVGSFYDTVDNLVIDPDAESLRDAKWVAKRCFHPYWEVEQSYGLAPDSLKRAATGESTTASAIGQGSRDQQYNRKRGLTNDLICYWKVWSRMGCGGLLQGASADLRDRLSSLGQNVYLVVTDTVGYPLNLPPELSAALMSDDPYAYQAALEQASQAFAWPTPFWKADAWPFTHVTFHPVPRRVWPVSHVQPGMGELKFINWAYSMLAGKVKTACRDFIAISKAAGEELKNKIVNGADYTVIEIEAIQKSIDDTVRFLQHPGFNGEIYKVIEAVSDNFEKRTGLTELMYGLSAKQLRSAEEASIKGDQVSVRPDDMANRVEDAMSEAARKEALAARWHLEAQDVAPVLGPQGAQEWEQLLLNTDPDLVVNGLEYRIEAGSTRKPNKARDAANFRDAMTNLFQPLYGYAQATGDVGPVNALIQGWARSIDLDASRFLLQPPPPPPPPAMPQRGSTR